MHACVYVCTIMYATLYGEDSIYACIMYVCMYVCTFVQCMYATLYGEGSMCVCVCVCVCRQCDP